MASAASRGPLHLGLDVGTQGTKGLLVAENGVVVARAFAAYGLIEGLPAGAAEQHPDTWIMAVSEVANLLFREAGRDGGRLEDRVRGIGVSGQQHGLVVLDHKDQVIRPAKLWCDTSTAAEAADLGARLGRPLSTGFTASKILWLKNHEPQAWRRVRTVLLPHDYVNFCLTGEKCMEPGDASGTGFFDLERRCFDSEAMHVLDPDLCRLLPELRMPGELAGCLSEKGAALLGLSPGIPVSTGGGDNMMSAIGSGATRSGVVVLSLGTSGTVFAHRDEPFSLEQDPSGLIALFCGSAGGWLPLLCSMNLTGVTEEVRRAWALDSAEDLEQLTRLGIQMGELRLVGGAAKNRLWCRILADVLGLSVCRLVELESAALGAALQAMWACRRQAGEQQLGINDVTGKLLQLEEEVVTPGPDVERYGRLRERFDLALGQHYGVG